MDPGVRAERPRDFWSLACGQHRPVGGSGCIELQRLSYIAGGIVALLDNLDRLHDFPIMNDISNGPRGGCCISPSRGLVPGESVWTHGIADVDDLQTTVIICRHIRGCPGDRDVKSN